MDLPVDEAQPVPRWPPVGRAALDVFTAAVRSLEDHHAGGRLGETLADPDLVVCCGSELIERYRRLERFELGPDSGWRRRAVEALLAMLHETLDEPRWTFPARDVAAPAEPDLDEEPWAGDVAASSTHGEVRLRLDQVVALRFWRVGFAFDQVDIAAMLELDVHEAHVRRFVTDLGDLAVIQQRLSGHERTGDIQVVADRASRGFEQLLVDILNEHEPVARRARLEEDFCEKTDLRVRVHGLGRKHGARVQATRIVKFALHSAKLDEIRRKDELVILGPWSLAEALSPGGAADLSPAEAEAFWRSFPDRPETVVELAARLREVFDQAVAAVPTDPRGPMAAVPEGLRRYLRAYVASEARRSTSELRRREAEERAAAQAEAPIAEPTPAPTEG